MMWLLTAHVRRYHQHYHSSGHVWQGRFRAFPIQEDDHLLTGCSATSNAIPSVPVWSNGPRTGPGRVRRRLRVRGPLWIRAPCRVRRAWLDYVNEPQTEAEVERLRESLRRGRPFGDRWWMEQTARRLGLEASLRPRGRPRKPTTDSETGAE